MVAAGESPEDAARRAAWRVFGSKPGAYGAGLQALIAEGGWQAPEDLADAYLAWGGWAYGAGSEGVAGRASFERRLGAVEAGQQVEIEKLLRFLQLGHGVVDIDGMALGL